MKPYHESKEEALGRFERKWLLSAMRECEANVAEVSRRGKVNRTTIWRLMRKHGFSKDGFLKLLSFWEEPDSDGD